MTKWQNYLRITKTEEKNINDFLFRDGQHSKIKKMEFKLDGGIIRKKTHDGWFQIIAFIPSIISWENVRNISEKELEEYLSCNA